MEGEQLIVTLDQNKINNNINDLIDKSFFIINQKTII